MIRLIAQVVCDTPTCPSWCVGADRGKRSTDASLARAARRSAHRKSWGTARGPGGRTLDVCPVCAHVRRIEAEAGRREREGLKPEGSDAP